MKTDANMQCKEGTEKFGWPLCFTLERYLYTSCSCYLLASSCTQYTPKVGVPKSSHVTT